jgi:ABC-type amino acid transport substrate-binding protein
MAVEKVVDPRALLLLLILWLIAPQAIAQDAPDPIATPAATPSPINQPVRVALAGQPPFVSTASDGAYQGLSIDVWEQVAAKNGWTFQYQHFTRETDALRSVAEGKSDILVGDISIVSSLFQTVEFSQPYARAGLQIMIPGARPHTLSRLIEDLETWGHIKAFWIILGVIALATLLVTLFERRHNPDFPKTWRDGIAEAAYYVISLSLGKSGYKGFGGWFGRLVMITWTIAGVVVVIYMTSSVTTIMTTEAINSHIVGPESLPGKVVGVVTGSRALTYLQHNGITYTEFPDMESAVQKLLQGSIPAIVGSAPLLQSFDKAHPHLNITEVGRVFEHYNYGFAMPIGSPLRTPLNQALLDLQENGVLLKIGQNYFGAVYQL